MGGYGEGRSKTGRVWGRKGSRLNRVIWGRKGKGRKDIGNEGLQNRRIWERKEEE